MEAASQSSVKVSCLQPLFLDRRSCVGRIECALFRPLCCSQAFLKAERGIWHDVIGGLGL